MHSRLRPNSLWLFFLVTSRMTTSTGRRTRVTGWYHSHPHIAVLPSHVDVRTQAMYQLLDSGFVGLTISCYSEDVYKVGRIQVIAFQSSDGGQNHMTRPIPLLSSVRTSSVIDLESPPSSSVDVSGSFSFLKAERPEQDSGDSKDGGRSLDLGVFFANADANYLGREKGGGNYLTNTSDTTIDVDPLDTSESMQEAMHRSNLDMR